MVALGMPTQKAINGLVTIYARDPEVKASLLRILIYINYVESRRGVNKRIMRFKTGQKEVLIRNSSHKDTPLIFIDLNNNFTVFHIC